MMDNRAENYDDCCFSENHEKIAALNDNFRKTFSLIQSSYKDSLEKLLAVGM